MANKNEIYKRIKISGILSFIPLILAAGALGGYFIGDYLEKKFNLAPFIAILCSAIGSAAAILETVRIIKLALKIEKK